MPAGDGRARLSRCRSSDRAGQAQQRWRAAQDVLEARRKAGSSLALLQALVGPHLRAGARLAAVRDACLASGQPAAEASLQARAPSLGPSAAALHRPPAPVSRGALGAALLLRRAEHHPAAQHLGGQGTARRGADAPGGARRAPRRCRPHMSAMCMHGQAGCSSVTAMVVPLFACLAPCV
jgi:hypothetical protein